MAIVVVSRMLRIFKLQPVVSGVVVVAIGLGLGANAIVFSIANAVVFRPLPYDEPDALVALWESNPEEGFDRIGVSPPTFFAWEREVSSFEHLAALSQGTVVLTDGEEPLRVPVTTTTDGYFAVLAATPALGRVFARSDGDAEQPLLVLSHGFWQRQLGGDRNVLGKFIHTDQGPFTVIGVMPSDFEDPTQAQAWTLGSFPDDPGMHGARYLEVLARLRTGVSVEEATAELDTLAARMAETIPAMKGYRVDVIPLKEQLIGDARPALLVLLGTVSFMALIICTNVSGMLVSRWSGRLDEISLRAALGASPLRLTLLPLSESVLLAVCGGVFGIVLAFWGIRLFAALAPADLPRIADVRPDASVITFTVALSLLAGVLASLAPVTQVLRADLRTFLGDSARGGGRMAHRIHGFLAVVAAAATLVLLIGGSLLLESFLRLRDVDPGFRVAGVLTAKIQLSGTRHPEAHQQAAFFTELLEALARHPQIEAVGSTTNLPLSGSNMRFPVADAVQEAEPGEAPAYGNYRAVSGGYFRTMGIPLLQGRDFTAEDTASSSPVVIVNQCMAESLWPAATPLDRTLRITYRGAENLTVVGVVGDVRHFSLARNVEPEMYVPVSQSPWPFAKLALRGTGNPKDLVPVLRDVVARLDPHQVIDEITTMEERLTTLLAPSRFYSLVVALFGAVALVSSLAGIYGLAARSAQERAHELAVRMAFGAAAPHVIGTFVRRGVLLTLVGCALGSLIALTLSPALTNLVFGVEVSDPKTAMSMAALLLLAAAIGTYVPARRASSREPMDVLRQT